MEPLAIETTAGTLTLRLARIEDISELIALNKECFPSMAEENVVWNRAQLVSHQKVFPEGQIVGELEGRVVGAVVSLIVDFGDNPYRPHTYSGITDGGYFYNHNPRGDTLYGADVFVDPQFRSIGIGGFLYEARRILCKRLNLRRILAGGRMVGYVDVAEQMSPEAYVKAVELGEATDQVLSFQLREGFVVRGVLKHYIRDPKSKNHATLIEWLNPDYTPTVSNQGKVRVACVQYQVRRIESFEDFADQVEYFVDTACDYRTDFLVFPEFFSVQLLSQKELKNLPPREGIERLADLEKPFMELMTRMAREYGLHIVAGSHPMRRGDRIFNACPIISPDGSYSIQPKLHITPSELKHWGISGGHELRVIHTSKAKIGVLICYDCEFPEAARYLADQGAEILFVPYCTDDRPAYQRVRLCAQARAIENQIYVVTSGIIGNLPSVPAMDIHYGKAGVFTPNDFEFARDGIQAEADSNVEMLLVTDLDINDLYRSRESGSVRQRMDRRNDLFEYRYHLRNDPSHFEESEELPVELFNDEDRP